MRLVIEDPNGEARRAENLAWAQRRHADQYVLDAAPGRLEELIEEARAKAAIASARLQLLEALRDEPAWRSALLRCGVAIVETDHGVSMFGGPGLWEGLADGEEAEAALRRAVARIDVDYPVPGKTDDPLVLLRALRPAGINPPRLT